VIPFVDLRAQYREIQEEVTEAVARVLANASYVLGSEVESFESEFADYCGAAQGVAVNSGTSALHLALLAAGVGPGERGALLADLPRASRGCTRSGRRVHLGSAQRSLSFRESIGAAIARLLGDPAMRQEFGEAAAGLAGVCASRPGAAPGRSR